MKTIELQLPYIETGWFGRATERNYKAKSTKYVHLYLRDEKKCLCGYKPHKTFQFQFNAAWAHLPYVTCPKCKIEFEKLTKNLTEQAIRNL